MLASNSTKFITFLCVLFSVTIFSQDKPRVYKEPEFIPDWNKPTEQPDRIVLNLTENPSNSMAVSWRTSPNVTVAYAEIAKATAAPKFWRNAKTITATTQTLDAKNIEQAKVIANYHSAIFKNLEPNTMYGYRVGDGKHWSEWIQFKTAGNKSDRFSFLYVGDAQNYVLELWSRLIRQGYKSNPDASFIIHAGDLINHGNNDSQWNEWFEAGSFIHSMVPSIPIPGNHEYRRIKEDVGEKELSIFWRPQFNLPLNGPESLKETAYYIDYQDVRIIGFDTNRRIQEQYEWLENVLKNNPKKWTIVTYHHPLYSASSGRDNEDLRIVLKPLFDKYHVDLALQGHDHSYARGRVAPTEYNLTSGLNKRDQTGTVYVVSVSGGKMYSLRPNAWNDLDADRERAAENTQLIQSITVEGNILRYESTTATGELYDAFDIIKNESGPNTFIEKRHTAISARYHDNTIPYNDKLPLDIEKKIMDTYKDYSINKVSLFEKEGKLFYKIKMYDKNRKKQYVTVDDKGTIIKVK